MTKGQQGRWVDWASRRCLSSSVNFDYLFFFGRLSLIFVILGMNDVRATDYRVTDGILHICIHMLIRNYTKYIGAISLCFYYILNLLTTLWV